MEQLGASQFAGSTRFQIAKNQIDQLFVKWLTHANTDKLINSLILNINEPDQQIQKAPPPLFVVSSHATPHSPKGGPRGHTPPRSPSGEKYLGRTLSPKTSGSLFDLNSGQKGDTSLSSFQDSDISGKSRPQGSPGMGANNPSNFAQNNQRNQEQMPYNKKFAQTDATALHQMMSGNASGQNQDMFYPRQGRAGSGGGSPSPAAQQDDESKQLFERDSGAGVHHQTISNNVQQVSAGQAARVGIQQAAMENQQQVSQTPQPQRTSKLGPDNNNNAIGQNAHPQLQQSAGQQQLLDNRQRMGVTNSSGGGLNNTRDQQALKKLNKTGASIENVPQFYHPQGKPIDPKDVAEFNENMEKHFGKSTGKSLGKEEFGPVASEIFKIPKIFCDMLFARLEQRAGPQGLPKLSGAAKANKAIVQRFWDQSDFHRKSPKQRLFEVIAKDGAKTIVSEDWKPMFKHLLEQHPGLEFLQQTPEFQERYADTVIMRIFYSLDTNDDGNITLRDFKKSNLFDVLMTVANEEDINKIRQYFSYEHFYVLYCRFWELDTDHDFLIDKEDFSRYEGHALSRKAVDRIFDQIPRKFNSGQEGKMGYEDFVWFMLSEEDKTSLRALQYWYKVIDLDDNGVITPHEMDYFYEEQVHRLEYLNHEPILFVDLLCQMNDMIKPSPTEGHFSFDQLRQYITQVGIFFNCLVNLNKFIAYETRDLFAIKHQLTEFPDYSEWDRFAKGEYERLAMEEEGGDDSEMIDAMDGWDSEDDSTAQTAGSDTGAGANQPADENKNDED